MRHRAVSASEVGEDGRLGRLHAEAHARDAPVAVCAKSLERRVFGVALDGDLGVVGTRDGVKDSQQLRRRASREGVPPPKKTDVAVGRPSSRAQAISLEHRRDVVAP